MNIEMMLFIGVCMAGYWNLDAKITAINMKLQDICQKVGCHDGAIKKKGDI